jgi:hypothetical protein
LPCRELANAQAAGKGRAATKVVVPKKIVIKKKPIPEEVIVISSDEEDEGKNAGGRISREGSTRKNGKTFSSTLTARSKVILFLLVFEC